MYIYIHTPKWEDSIRMNPEDILFEGIVCITVARNTAQRGSFNMKN
jgi:hypothetical protein